MLLALSGGLISEMAEKLEGYVTHPAAQQVATLHEIEQRVTF